MDRTIVYPGSIPLDTDMLNLNRNAMAALGALIQATLGSATLIDGLAVAPTVPASLNIQVGPGSITLITTVDATNYGSLAADTADPVVKMGINQTTSFFPCPAPAATGQSIGYLLQAQFAETDANPVVLPYYNATNPTVPFLGAGNLGVAQPTMRTQRVQLQVKAGAAAATGSQVVPSPDAGWTPIAAIGVDAGMTAIGAGNITPAVNAPVVPYKLPSLRPGFSALTSFTASGVFVVPQAVTRAKITVVGGGGAGGSNATLPGGGGGAGGQAVSAIAALVPGTAMPVTIGAGGLAVTGASFGPGGNGGTSSFGTLVSATGGIGGGAAPSASAYTGGNGGSGIGGAIDYAGAFGTDGIPTGNRGGDGGGPGSGRGATAAPGLAAPGFGGGGGGGAPGFLGANGAAGLVIVEF